MSYRLKTRHVLVIVGIGTLLAFQNCAQSPNSTFNSSTSSSSSFESKLPFAYQSQLDTISYMSCSNMTTQPEPRAYFTIRAGAYNNQTGGIALTPDFTNATKYYTDTDRAQAFANSDLNSNTLLSLSIRSAGNYQSVWTGSTTGPGQDLDAFLPALDSDGVAGPLGGLHQSGQMLNYFPGPGNQRLMEASLRFMNFENVAQDTRNSLNSQAAVLVAGYTNTSDTSDTQLRGPDPTKLTTSVYGTGYYLHFSLPVNYASGDLRVLSTSSGIQEINLQTGGFQPSSWNCSSNYEFMVVRPEDKAAGLVICNATVDRYANSTQQAALAAIRRVLRVEDWYVDVANHCVMPKNTGDFCYGDIGTRAIEYGNPNCIDSSTTLCPHFVSVCLRN